MSGAGRPGPDHQHRLSTGVTGAGTTVTLQALAEGFSNIGMLGSRLKAAATESHLNVRPAGRQAPGEGASGSGGNGQSSIAPMARSSSSSGTSSWPS
ncbi:helicase HerA-like domain-containing protein [Immundisolibacter sp.]|uniref:helicase HerA-like domain-containing protein n=1 Tax=Immundisolibacter sp. TaxID=1934948 RepID=UPI003567E251